jgi:protein-S-isoprenylcysteine O-methyltransferase Ste14
VSLYRLDRVSSYRFDFANRLGKMKANILTLVIALLGLSFLGIHYGSKPWTPTRIAGAVIGLPSLALFVLARIELGSSFSVRPKAQTLVTHGLYSRIRNPIYVFGGLVAAGGSFSTSTSRALYGFSLRSFHCRFIEHARKKKSFRQDSVTNTSNINRTHGSNTLDDLAHCAS